MILIYKNIRLGRIEDTWQDGPTIWGQFTEEKDSMPSELKSFLLFITNPKYRGVGPPFPAEYDDARNWAIVDGTDMKPIYTPGLYSDDEIGWRWRRQ